MNPEFDRAESTKAFQAGEAYRSTAPSGSFESRTAIPAPDGAISTQLPFPMLRRALRQVSDPSPELSCGIATTTPNLVQDALMDIYS